MFKNMIPVVEHSLKYNRSLDGLRGVAISLVILFHIWPKHISFGYVGVDIFFVLSGYLITKIIYTKLKKNTFSFLEFYRNRVRRIFPAMITVVFASFIIGYLFLFPDEFLELIKHLKSSLFFYQNFRLIEEVGYWDTAGQLKPMLHFWSLSIEEQFYVLWPITIFILYFLKIDIFKGLLFITSIMLVLPQFFEIDMFYHSFSRFWELSLGGLVFAIEYKKKKDKFLTKIAFSSLYIFVLAIFVSYGNEEFNIYKTLIITVSTGFLILCLNRQGIHNKILSSSVLVFLGLISFPLYLWHYVIISYFNILKFDIVENSFWIITISIFLSLLTYRYIEFYSRQQESYKFALTLVVVVVLSGLSFQYMRLSKIVLQRDHLNLNLKFEEQFQKYPLKNKNGIKLVNKISNKETSIDYILSTSSDKEANYIAIIGDSHAYASYHGFANLFKDQGYETILLANSACPSLIEGAIGRNEEKINECKNKIENTYDFLEKKKNITKVILITRGQYYAKNRGFGTIDGGHIEKGFKHKAYLTDKNSYNLEEEFYRSVKKTFAYFSKKKNIEFYYLLENPELGFSPIDYMERPFLNKELSNSKNKVSYDEYNKRQEEYRKRIYDISKSFPSITILDPEPIFCDTSFCYAIKNDKMLYRDDDHLSIEGSILQAEGLKKYIFKRD